MKLLSSLFFLFLVFFNQVSAGRDNTLLAWESDLEALRKGILEHHVSPFRSVDKKEFYGRIEALKTSLSGLSEEKIIIEISKIVSSLEDGHSFVDQMHPLVAEFTDTTLRFPSFPVRLSFFQDGIYIVSAHESLQHMVGAKVTSISGTSTEECFELVGEIFPSENDMSNKLWSMAGLVMPEILKSEGIIKEGQSATFEVEKDNVRSRVSLSLDPFKTPSTVFGNIADKTWINAFEQSNNLLPLYLREPKKKYWIDYNTKEKLLYVQLKQVGKKRETEQMLNSLKSIIDVSSIDKFILDIRHNPGGETGSVNSIVKSLASSSFNEYGSFFVLIGRKTFSSAQLLATALESFTYAIFVGEPTGAKVHFAANSRPNLILPNSKLKIFLSTIWWQPTNMSDDRRTQDPNIHVELTFNDYVNNIDPLMTLIRNK